MPTSSVVPLADQIQSTAAYPEGVTHEAGKQKPNRRRSSAGFPQIFSNFPQLQKSRVRRQLGYMQSYKAWFVLFYAVVQLGMLVWSIVVNGQFENVGENPFLGPSKMTLLKMGARSVICMRRQIPVPPEITTCPISLGYQTDIDYCGLYGAIAEVCGMAGFVDPCKLHAKDLYVTVTHP